MCVCVRVRVCGVFVFGREVCVCVCARACAHVCMRAYACLREAYHVRACAHTYPHTHGYAGGYLTYQNNDYKLLELVFRTPSEHRVDDEYKAGEIHLVHQSAAGRCKFATSTHPSVCLPAYI